ncbi:MAG: hypothetical protein A2Y07_04080 [Planctomycetes bacterium GWF2_50_10]|nr:MAG: hypothetical protein A2Y07_04080 [Planctomycetes bacterium GWF2_50_10]
MKDSKKYSEALAKTVRSLKRKYGKIEKPEYGLSAEVLVYAVLSQYLSESASASAIKKLAAHFVDWNDLRVARTDELTDVIGKDTVETREMADTMTRVLMAIFNKYDVMNLEAVAEAGKRQAKAILEKLIPESQYVINYVVLTAFEGHAIPLTGQMTEYLKANELVHPDSTPEEIEGFLERQVPANQTYEFYALIRKDAESTMPKRSISATISDTDVKTSSKSAKKQ